MEFWEQYKRPEWQRRRTEILTRDDWTCQDCGSKEEQLHVHHRFYEKGRKVWEYEDDELVTLCKYCHREISTEINEIRITIGELQSHELMMFRGVIHGFLKWFDSSKFERMHPIYRFGVEQGIRLREEWEPNEESTDGKA